MMAAIPPMLCIGDLLSRCINKNIYQNVAYASYCIYLVYRMVFKLLIKGLKPSSGLITVAYLVCCGLPITYMISYYLQTIYD